MPGSTPAEDDDWLHRSWLWVQGSFKQHFFFFPLKLHLKTTQTMKVSFDGQVLARQTDNMAGSD